jgi:hypothetical protein
VVSLSFLSCFFGCASSRTSFVRLCYVWFGHHRHLLCLLGDLEGGGVTGGRVQRGGWGGGHRGVAGCNEGRGTGWQGARRKDLPPPPPPPESVKGGSTVDE